LLCFPNPRGDARRCQLWAQALRANGHLLLIPEIVDYEVRRELLRANRTRSIFLLDQFLHDNITIRLDSAQLRHAAELWAQVRQLGLPTAGPDSLDADAIVAAQALSVNDPKMTVATANPGHLSRFVTAELWQNIPTT
jgi:predicted nucleic acid-binding protein